ncbi:MAG: cytochrome c-type biogenesis CcmF C-terminal domain-containing protein, partial [Pseudohongiellaceae bacterium]
AGASLVLGVVIPLVLMLEFSLAATITVMLASWILLTMLKDIANKVANKPTIGQGLRALPLSYWGMQIAHLGVAVLLVGAALTSFFSSERSVLLTPGQSTTLGNYEFTLEGTEPIRGPNFVGDRVEMTVRRGDEVINTLYPEKRVYLASGSPSTEMAIDSGFLRDLFVTLGEQRDAAGWTMTIYVKPFVRWVWLAAILMAIGGTTAALDKRYRRLRRKAIEGETVPTRPATDKLQTAS